MENQTAPSYEELSRRLAAAESALAEAEAREVHLKKVLLAIRNVKQGIVREEDPGRLIAHACENLTKTMGYYNAWIALLDTAGRTASQLAASGFEVDFGDMGDRLARGAFPACMGDALKKPGIKVVRAPVSECPDCPLAAEYKGRSGMVARLGFGGRVYGILSVSVPDTFADDPAEQSLFCDLADDLACALNKIETGQQLAAARECFRSSEDKLIRAFESIPDAIVISRVSDGAIVDVNKGFTRISGFAKEEVLGRTSGEVGLWVEPGARDAYIAKLIRDGVVHNHEADYRDRSGHILNTLISGTIFESSDGRMFLSIVRDVSLYRRQNARIDLLGRMLDDAPASISIYDTGGRFLYANRLTFTIHGYEKGEFLGIPLQELDAPESAALLPERFQKITGEGKAVFEVVHFRKDGSSLPLQVMAKAIEWEGRPAVLSIATDISERKSVEKALRANERFLRQVIDSSPACIFVKDKASRYILVNRVIAGLYGLPSEAMIGKTDVELAAERHLGMASAEHFMADDSEIIEKKTEKHIDEELFITHDGGKRWFHTVKTPLNTDVFQECMLGVATDITDRKQADQALRESEEKYRLLADNTVDCIWMLDMNLNFTYINPAVEKMTGWTVGEWIGSNLKDHCDEENFAIMAGVVMKALERLPENPGTVFEAVMRKKNGEPIPVEITGKVLLDASGTPAALQGVTRDISERKQAELERGKLQDQLIHAQKMESVGRLAGGVAHDFNNMLSVILGYAESALERIPQDDPLYEDILEMQEAGRRAADITHQLLAFARRQNIVPAVLDLNEKIEEMLRMLRRLIGENIDLTWHPRPGLWPVKLDPAQIHQILANLCVNARDAIADVGKITIATDQVSIGQEYCANQQEIFPGDFVLLEVTDSGCGMDAAIQEKIYEPFFTTKGVGKGTGLGLPMVYGIMRQNNGFINLCSKPGAGTTIKLYFPRHSDEPVEGGSLKPEKLPEGRGETVLVVEDDDMVLSMAKKMLMNFGYRVMSAATPAEALKLGGARPGDIDLVMMDVIMPEMNGRELSEKLREYFPGIRVLFMSGYTANVIAHHGVLDEDVMFIQKPFSRIDLAKKVREALKRKEEA